MADVSIRQWFPYLFKTLQRNYSDNVIDLLKMSWKRPFAPDELEEDGSSANESFVDKMGSDTLVVVGLIGLIIVLIIIMVILNCWLKCCDDKNKGRRYSTKSTDIKYIQQIQRLLEQQKEVEARRQAGQRIIVKDEVSSAFKIFLKYSLIFPLQTTENLIPSPSSRPTSRASSPSRSRSRASVNPQTQEKLAKLKEELEHYRIDHQIQIRSPSEDRYSSISSRRRTWGGLQDEESDEDDQKYEEVRRDLSSPDTPRNPKFVPLKMPNRVDASVQTT